MLTKPQVFYDDTHKQALETRSWLSKSFLSQKAQRIKPTLYDGSVISSQHVASPVFDDEKTLILEEVSRSKMLAKQNDPISKEKKVNTTPINYAELNRLSEDFGKRFLPQQELSNKQAFWLQTSHPNTDQSASLVTTLEVTDTFCVSNIALGMFKLDLDPLAPRLLQNREAHIYYLKHTQEQADILQGIVEQAKAKQPLDNALDLACKHAKQIQELLVYVRDTCPNAIKLSEKKVAITPMNKVKKVRFSKPLTSSSNIKQVESSKTSDFNTPVLSFTGLKCSTSTCKSQLTSNKKNDRISQKPSSNKKNKVEAQPRKVVQIVIWYLDFGCSKHMTGNRSQLMNFVSKFLGIVRLGNDQVAKIMGYGDYQPGNLIISRVYYVKGLGHNLFSVGQFCDPDLEVAFRKNTCFIWNLEGVDLLSGSRDTNLYTISLDDMLKTSLICLLSNASKTKSWLWHRWLSHINFGTLNKLAKDGLARGIPKLKFQKDHLCSECALGKSEKSSHQPKAEDTKQEKLYLLHMDLCGPMHVESINGKKYILVIIDDYSRFTWV
ncbi:retrovirus-related pol polyprotein from transposon TNT 1-94 [Tanacetum coccineum]|uniref:Retrovirus-related pol polyprotein from transposon TNT 1-94 n=1 Tax=Tanacetum coccineum TaxID=301880 RepID=A0ABQ5BHI5_9ASTR